MSVRLVINLSIFLFVVLVFNVYRYFARKSYFILVYNLKWVG